MEKKTVKDVLTFASNELKAANIRNAVIDDRSDSAVYMNVRRAFSIDGTITVDFEVQPGKGSEVLFKPRVSVNFPACNKDVIRAAAFMHLVNELVLLSASLQAQLDDAFKVIEV